MIDRIKACVMATRIARDFPREYKIQELEELIVFLVARMQLTDEPLLEHGTQQKNKELKVAPVWKNVIGTRTVEK